MNIQNIGVYALSVSPDTKYPMFSSEAFAKAAEVVIIGMAMVFAVLALLWLALTVFKWIFASDTTKKKASSDTSAPATVVTPVAEPVAKTDEGELIAVITAAIAAYRAEEEGLTGEAVDGFRVVSFKRAAKGRAWNSNK